MMKRTRFVKLPEAPETGSPVPHLTSLHAARARGPYGDSSYRGNCGGELIADLIRFYRPRHVLDPMTGSGTCRDVCRSLGVPCTSGDIHSGFDATDPASYSSVRPADFVWLHPPYWQMIRYGEHANCLSNAPTLDVFLLQLRQVLANCRGVLTSRGRIAVLIGGYAHAGHHIPLPHLAMSCALRERLRPDGTEIIRFQYGNTSSRRRYRRSFIPGLHDQCLIFRKMTGRWSSAAL